MFTIIITSFCTVAAPLPVLLEPEAAVAQAGASGRAAADIHLLVRDPVGAIEALGPITATSDPRDLRIAVDAAVALGRTSQALRWAEQLGQHPGWQVHAGRTLYHVEDLRFRQWIERTGLMMFALAFLLLVSAGARELLVLRRETLVLAACTLASILILGVVAPGAVPLFGLLYLGFLTLGHATSSAAYRIGPGGRGKAILATLLVVGCLGVTLAVGARVHLSLLSSALATG